MASDVEVIGLGNVIADMARLRDKMMRRELLWAIRPGAKYIAKAIKQQAPVRTGTLRDSLTLKVGKGKDTDPFASIYTHFKKNYSRKGGKKTYPFYVKFVHDGTVTHEGPRPRKHRTGGAVGRQRIKPNEYIYRAFDESAGEAAEMVLSKIMDNL
mgnify:CR=1 FL=1